MRSLEIKPLWLDVHSITLRVNHEEFEKLCQDNPDRSFELTAAGGNRDSHFGSIIQRLPAPRRFV